MARKFRDLRAKMSPANRAKSVKRAAGLMREMTLHELRAARRLSQEALGVELKSRQSSVSRLERRRDMYVSTLRGYIEAMGGKLEIVARFPGGTIKISQFDEAGR